MATQMEKKLFLFTEAKTRFMARVLFALMIRLDRLLPQAFGA